MTGVARALSRAFLSSSGQFDPVKQIALFCAAGLLVSLLMLTYGVDLSPGFF
jgi:ribose/xylose/arabinose/galactoside ABC-type transport system permease subunit